jgi:hypothetical protein
MRRHALSFVLVALTVASAPAAFAQDAEPMDAPITFLAGTGNADSYQDSDTAADASALEADSAESMTQMAERLADPAMQDSVAGMVEKMSSVMMKLPVGKFVAAIEDARPGTVKEKIREDATLADIAGPKADGMPEMLGEQSRTAMSMMSGLGKAFAVMLPQFEQLGKEMEKELKAAQQRR